MNSKILNDELRDMQTQLKDVYGQRTTPGVKILLLIAIVIFGLCAAFSGSGDTEKQSVTTTNVT